MDKEMTISQLVEIKGVKSQVEIFSIAVDGSDTGEDLFLQELEEDFIAVTKPRSEVNSSARYVDSEGIGAAE